MPANCVAAQNLIDLDAEDRTAVLTEMAEGLSVPDIVAIIQILRFAALKRGAVPLGIYPSNSAAPMPTLPMNTAIPEPEPAPFQYNMPQLGSW